MICPNCGTTNVESSQFCFNCKTALNNNQNPVTSPSVENNVQQIPNQNGSYGEINQEQSPVVNNTTNQNGNYVESANIANPQMNNNVNESIKVSFIGYFLIIISTILKPFTAFKEELKKLNEFKNSAFLSLIVSGVFTIINFIVTAYNTVKVTQYDFILGKEKTNFVFENLKKLDFLQLIGKNFLIYLGVIAVIAVIYYIAGLIAKKQPTFSRLLGISAIATTPVMICSLILSPLISLIWADLAIPVIIIGAAYSIILLYEGMNSEISLDGNAKYYLNFICLAILAISGYYLCINLILTSVANEFGDLMDLFNY